MVVLVSNNAAFSCQKAENVFFIGHDAVDLNNRSPVFCDHHGLTAFGDLVHHGETLRFELSGWNLLHRTSSIKYVHYIMTTLERARL